MDQREDMNHLDEFGLLKKSLAMSLFETIQSTNLTFTANKWLFKNVHTLTNDWFMKV